MSESNKDLQDIARTTVDDFYELLGVDVESTETEVKRAYRKTSIKYHPDKNKDDPAAADRFIRLGIARDILLNATLKAEYDRSRLRRKEKALKDGLMDEKRRKMIDDLLSKEREAADSRQKPEDLKRKRPEDLTEADKLELKIQRLAADGKRRRIERAERLERERLEEEARIAEKNKPAPVPGETDELARTIKVRFRKEGDAALWDKEKISQVFSKYGKVDMVVMGKDKKIRVSGEKQKKVVATIFLIYTRVDHAYFAFVDAKDDFACVESVGWMFKEPDTKSPTNSGFSTSPASPTPKGTPDTPFRPSSNAGLGKESDGPPSISSLPPFCPKTSLEELTMIRLKHAEKNGSEGRSREAAGNAEVTPKGTACTSSRASFHAAGVPSFPSFSSSFNAAGIPIFSFSAPPSPEVTRMRLREAEEKRLEEEIRQEEAAEDAEVT